MRHLAYPIICPRIPRVPYIRVANCGRPLASFSMPQASLEELIWLIYIGKANLAKPGEVTKSMEPTKQPLHI